MKRISTSLAVCSLFFLLFIKINNAGAQVSTRDSLALVDLYNGTGGNSWNRHANWLTTAPVARWEGITVENQRVTKINLAQNNLQGRLPGSFGNLDSLNSLSLNQNNLQGGLPASFTKLTRLITVILSDNPNLGTKLTSDIGNLTNLQTLRLEKTGTKGSLPASIGKLLQLGTLNLANNELSGSLPASVANLSKLTYLGLDNNHFSGSLPASGNLPLLVNLFLNNNEFSGPFPGWFSKAPSLYTISISNNQFTGQLPDELNNIANLYQLLASYNHFSGPIPDWAFNKYFLFDVFLDHNDFSQPENKCVRLGNTTDYLNISYNRYTFNGLECIDADNFFYFIAPQARIPVHAYKNGLAVSAGGTLSNNTYKWFKVGTAGSRTIVADSVFTPAQSGSYYAKVTNASVPTLTLFTDTFTYTKPAPAAPLSLSVYPNPVATGSIRLNGLPVGISAKITVADPTGYVWLATMSRQQSAIQIDVSRLKAGSYLLTVNDGKEVRTISFVKQ